MSSSKPVNGPLAAVLHRLRWPVAAVWLCAMVALYPFATSLSSEVDNTPQANLPGNAESTLVAQQLDWLNRGQPAGDSITVVFATSNGGLTGDDRGVVERARTTVGHLSGQLSHLSAPGSVRYSVDGRAAQFTAAVTATPTQLSSLDASTVQSVRHAVTTSMPDGLHVAVTGSAALTADGGIGNQNTLLATSFAIVVLILLVVYRSPVLWLCPLSGTIASLIVAKAGTHALVTAGFTVTSLSTAILTVLVLGASTDYAMLLVHRYREELERTPTPAEAMAIALRRTIPTLTASAATVICAMLCLLVAQSASLRGLGPVAVVAVVAVLLAQLTLLPALLLLVGRPGFWPRVPRNGQLGREESNAWHTIGAHVARRPPAVAVASVLLLGAACFGLAGLHTDNDPIALVKGHPGSVTGTQLLTDHFPPGEIGPLVMMSPPGQSAAAVAVARATPNVAAVSAGVPKGSYAFSSVVLAVPPYEATGYATIAHLRTRLDRAAPAALVGGGPTVQYDTIQAARRDAIVLIPLVLLVVMITISVLVRAIVAPLVLVATTALSFAASLGLANRLWIALGYPGIEAQLPLYVFVFLVALGVDYNIFLIARIREETPRLGTQRATLRGLAVTGGVITAAGIVLAATFAGLARLPYLPVAQVGTAIAIGVLLDTVLVRTILVPAALLILGDRAWWPSRVTTDTSTIANRQEPRNERPSSDAPKGADQPGPRCVAGHDRGGCRPSHRYPS
ncbi:MAG: MMPL family transporter [Humibacillus sp.]|nr:MMPL family transporter [Humibacillus sp.]MDN5775929.1 MMPL family transporter [Humibacillus sp.]